MLYSGMFFMQYFSLIVLITLRILEMETIAQHVSMHNSIPVSLYSPFKFSL